MDLINSYVEAVKNYLPNKEKDDIGEELRNTLLEHLEEQAGNDASEHTQVALLKRFGHPFIVAQQFLGQRYLIGPHLFPYYLYSLRVGASIIFVIHLVLFVLSQFSSGDFHFSILGLGFDIVKNLINAMVFITVIFAILEYCGEKLNWFDDFDPSTLKHLSAYNQVSRSNMISNFIAEAIGLLWLNEMISWSHLWQSNQTSLEMMLSPAFDALIWPMNILLLGSLLFHAYMLFINHWTVKLSVMESVLNICFVVLIYMILTTEPLLVSSGIGENIGELAKLVERMFYSTLLVIGVVSLYDALKYSCLAVRMIR